MSPESHLDFYGRWHRLSGPYIQWQFEQFRPYIGQRVADVGCGLGNFTGRLLDRSLYLGVDRDAELLAELTKEYGHSPIVHTAALDVTSPRLPETLRGHAIDTILCVNVLEHIEDDRRALSGMVGALPAGGHLCVLVPALPRLFGTLDVLDGHRRRYTRSTLAALFSGHRGTLKRLRYFNIAGVAGWFVKGRVLKQKTHTDDNYRLMNLLVPIVGPLERVMPPPLGMSVIAVFERA